MTDIFIKNNRIFLFPVTAVYLFVPRRVCLCLFLLLSVVVIVVVAVVAKMCVSFINIA